MDELKENVPEYKIYKDKFMYGVGYLGGPLAAGYIIAENFKAFGDREKYKKTWIITIIATVVIFMGVIMIPDSIKIPNYIIPMIYTFAAYGIMRNYQGKQIDEHILKGGPLFSGGRAFLAALICIVITIAVFLPIAFVMLQPDNNYEVYLQPNHHVTHEISYNADNVDKNEIKKLGETLCSINYLDTISKTYLYVDKDKQTFKINVPFIGNAWEDPNVIAYYTDLQKQLKLAYQPANSIEIVMCDTLLNIQKTIK